MNSEIRKMFCDLLGEDRVFTEEAMSQHTTFKIGGPADYFLMPDKGEDVGRVIKICKEKEISVFYPWKWKQSSCRRRWVSWSCDPDLQKYVVGYS